MSREHSAEVGAQPLEDMRDVISEVIRLRERFAERGLALRERFDAVDKKLEHLDDCIDEVKIAVNGIALKMTAAEGRALGAAEVAGPQRKWAGHLAIGLFAAVSGGLATALAEYVFRHGVGR